MRCSLAGSQMRCGGEWEICDVVCDVTVQSMLGPVLK